MYYLIYFHYVGIREIQSAGSSWFVCCNAIGFLFWYINVNIWYTSHCLLFIIAPESDPRISWVFGLISFINIALCIFCFDYDDRILAIAICWMFFS